MENWKKALVVVAFLATIGGLVATQYLQARVNMELKLSEKIADVQFIAYDLSPAGYYVLKNDTTNGVLKVSLGAFAWHYHATYTAAFAIAWVRNSGNSLKITKIDFTGYTGTVPVNVYLHQNATLPSESGWTTSTENSACTIKYYDSSTGSQTVADPWVLEPLTGISYSTGQLMGNTKSGATYTYFTATWTDPDGAGSEGNIWVSDDAGTNNVNASYLQKASTYTNAGGCNFVWVEIVIDPAQVPTNTIDLSGVTMIIYVELVS